MSRRKNWLLLDATHRVLYAQPRLSVPEIFERLNALGFRPKRTNVPVYVEELRAMGILEVGSNRPRFAPLYAAYLISDVPPSDLSELRTTLERHNTRVGSLRQRARLPRTSEVEQLELFLHTRTRLELLVGWPSQVVQTRGTEDQLRELENECRSLGGHPRLFIVDRPDEASGAESEASAA